MSARTTSTDLASIYPEPTQRVLAKARPSLDAHAKKFIAMSPFCVLATSSSDGSVDASPRGGTPGFVHVAQGNRIWEYVDTGRRVACWNGLDSTSIWMIGGEERWKGFGPVFKN
jgi:predicted pyridoxine 5'-phosphate oxidase superfamily flavin-nucleotide-binding protein